MYEPIWDGIVNSRVLGKEGTEFRNKFADAAKNYQWDKLFEYLDKHQELINITRPDGSSWYTPLHQAAHGGADIRVINNLIDRGAFRTIRNSKGERPVDVAKKKSHSHLIDVP